jgi:hypothetical protein
MPAVRLHAALNSRPCYPTQGHSQGATYLTEVIVALIFKGIYYTAYNHTQAAETRHYTATRDNIWPDELEQQPPTY